MEVVQDVHWQVERMSQGVLAMSTQEQISLALLCLATVGVVGFIIYLIARAFRKREEKGKMAPPVTLKQSHKGLLVDVLTNEIEDRVLFNKMNRKTARLLYVAVGRSLDIPELLPTAELKCVIKSRQQYQKKNGKKRPNIPGEKPIQLVTPNKFKPPAREAVKSLFKKQPVTA